MRNYFGCLLFSLFAPVLGQIKYGTCPKLQGSGVMCTDFCQTDSSCFGRQKCCSNGCGHVCADPFLAGTSGGLSGGIPGSSSGGPSDSTSDANGSGPIIPPIPPPVLNRPQYICRLPVIYGLCFPPNPQTRYAFKQTSGRCEAFVYQGCWANANNFNTMEECQQTCGTRVRPKDGTCPVPTGTEPCIESCSTDNDCAGNQKCCSNGCGRACQNPSPSPLPIKICPDPYRLVAMNPFSNIRAACMRQETCTADSQCSAGRKCCQSLCGKTCLQPTAPCAEKRCLLHNEICIVQEEFCMTPPCQPVAKCVPDPEQLYQPRKLGSCPEDTLYSPVGNCVSECVHDDECSGVQKCCRNGCGMSCQNPGPDRPQDLVTPHCSETKCGPGEHCEMHRISPCVYTDCSGVPVCVKDTETTDACNVASSRMVLDPVPVLYYKPRGGCPSGSTEMDVWSLLGTSVCCGVADARFSDKPACDEGTPASTAVKFHCDGPGSDIVPRVFSIATKPCDAGMVCTYGSNYRWSVCCPGSLRRK